jgi:hypothetical protein
VSIVADHVLEAADAALDRLAREQAELPRSLPHPFDERVLEDEPPRTDHERWLRERVVCNFCREDYKRSEPLWVRVNLPGRFAGRIICATCISEIGFTGCEWYVHSAKFASHVINVFGRDTPPEDWEYCAPGWQQVAEALERGPEIYTPLRRGQPADW